MNRDCKIKPIHDFYKGIKDEYTQFIGIAVDEPKRLARLTGNKISLLAEYNYTEQMAYELCQKYGLLSPIYENSNRGGCWFCMNSHINQYAKVRKEHPEYWNRLLEMGKTPNCYADGFKYGKTIFEVDKMIDRYELDQELIRNQISMFDEVEE